MYRGIASLVTCTYTVRVMILLVLYTVRYYGGVGFSKACVYDKQCNAFRCRSVSESDSVSRVRYVYTSVFIIYMLLVHVRAF